MNFIPHLREPVICVTLALGICAAQADHAPVLVVPGRADIPVMINGYDASWGVVEGDWGLHRPGFVSPTVIPAPTAVPLAPARRYFPSLGAAPHSGRYEIEPPANRVLPRPAPTYYREWSTSSDSSAPATIPGDVPSIIQAAPDDQGYGPQGTQQGMQQGAQPVRPIHRFSRHRRNNQHHHH